MTGRHRARGPSPEPYLSVLLDQRERAMAADLSATYPGWFVVWGPYWRCWSAFARFSERPLVVHADAVDVLLGRMGEAELAVRTHRW